MQVRLQKIIADRGFCSRRKAEELIAEGRVKVDGNILTELGNKFEEDVEIEIDGQLVKSNVTSKKYYFLVNKPLGFICTAQDDRGRKEVTRLIPPEYGRLFPVGRLDINTSGAIILTNDGDFANLVMHPSSSFEKTYRVTVDGILKNSEAKRLENGVMLDDGMTAKAKVKINYVTEDHSIFDISIHEGRNRQVRRMVDTINHRIYELNRIRIGPISLGDLNPGEFIAIPQNVVESIKATCRINKKNNKYIKK